MLDYRRLLTCRKSYLQAPAGFGKTYTIAECIKRSDGNQLILTHTHAGIASIKEKLKKKKISSNKYHIETICGFAQKYVSAFDRDNKLPPREDKNYFTMIICKATVLFSNTPAYIILTSTYDGIFVDEYQDCTQTQHDLLMVIAKFLPMHIFGDPLQGIFDFNEQIVDLEDKTQMKEFKSEDNTFYLSEPHRWIQSGNTNLGDAISDIRGKLIQKEEIDLKEYADVIDTHILTTNIYQDNQFKDCIYNKEFGNNLLVLDAVSNNKESRHKLVKIFKSLQFLEAFDHKDFYEISKLLDQIDKNSLPTILQEIFDKFFQRDHINKWFNFQSKKCIKNKRVKGEKELEKKVTQLKDLWNDYLNREDIRTVRKLFLYLKNDLKIFVYRRELFNSLIKSIELSIEKNISIYDSMVQYRNKIRSIGRKVDGKFIGTTLLTKGLEFDNVIIFNAERFDCPKNFYVAISRATKKLTIFSKKIILNPYPKK